MCLRRVVALVVPAPDLDPDGSARARTHARLLRAQGWQVLEIGVGLEAQAGLHATRDGSLRLASPRAGHWSGDDDAEVLLARGWHERRVQAVHLVWTPSWCWPSLVERAWLLGVPTFVSVTGPVAVAPTEAAALTRHLRDESGLLEGVLVEAPRLVAEAERWSDVPVRHLPLADRARSASVWAAALAVAVGDLRPPEHGPSLSVVITTFDRPALLRRALEALTVQTLPAERFEVVVVDDAGDHPAAPVVAEFADRLRLRLHRTSSNVGPGEARNQGVALATGDVVLLLDDDDVAGPRCLAQHVRSHAEHPGPYDAVLGHTGLAPDVPYDAVTRHVLGVGQEYMGSRTTWRSSRLGAQGLWCGRVSLKRPTLTANPFALRVSEDTDLAFRLEPQGLVVHVDRLAVQHVADRLGLESLLRRTAKLGRVRITLDRRHPGCVVAPVEADALFASLYGRADAVAARCDSLTGGRLDDLRRPNADGPTPLEGVHELLRERFTFRFLHGVLLERRREAVAERGERLRIGIEAQHAALAEVVVGFAEVAQGAPLTLVVAVPDEPGRIDAALALVADTLLRAGFDLDGDFDLELVAGALSGAAVDVVVGEPQRWLPGDPLPLLDHDHVRALRELVPGHELSGAFRR